MSLTKRGETPSGVSLEWLARINFVSRYQDRLLISCLTHDNASLIPLAHCNNDLISYLRLCPRTREYSDPEIFVLALEMNVEATALRIPG